MSDTANPEFDDRLHVRELLSRDDSEGWLVRGEFCSKLLGIGLQNFQAITEPAFLPFGRLTLLYGPNSAGKSTVSDALELWSDLGQRTSDGTQRMERLSRWANFDRNDATRESARYVGGSNLTALWIVAGSVGDIISYPDEDCSIDSPSYVFRALAYREPYAVRWLSNGSEPRGFDVWSGADAPDPLIRFIRDANGDCALRLNRAHPSLRLIEKAMSTHLGQPDIEVHVATPSIDGSWLEFKGHYRWNGQGNLDQVDVSGAKFRGREEEIARFGYLRSFVLEALERAGEAASLRVVHPTRDVPESNECGFTLRSRESMYSAVSLSRPPAHTAWRRIALDGIRQGFNSTIEREKLTTYINRAMGGKALLGLDYQLEVVHYAQGRWQSSIRGTLNEVPAVLWQEKAKRLESDGDHELYAHVQLLDTRGHVLQVHDVGTGVSQLIPVLEALHFGKALIHQPELHLHPRLQSALGDLVVEPLRGPRYWSTIVESHSEHLLLRVLRRIREVCGKDRTKQPEFSPDDVVVLYFAKDDGGRTHVRRLRVNAEGEFVDRWPNGFFTERDEDLFGP